MSNVGYATLQVIPSLQGMKAKIDSELSDTIGSSGDSAGKSLGSKLMGGLGKSMKVGAVAIGASIGGVLALTLSKGWNRLTNIDSATASLTGLGHSAAAVTGIMNDALTSVKGTAFGLDEAAKVAAGAVAAGIKPGKDLAANLRLVADAATIGGSTMGEMGAIFNKVAASNKLQGDVINQLNDQGIPILQFLGKTLGKTSEEVTKMAAKGQIDFGTFQKAMQDGLGGAALSSGATLRGTFANVHAAMGRLGASILGGLVPILKAVGPELIVVFDGITDRLKPLAANLNATFGPQILAGITGSGDKVLAFVDRLIAGVTSLAAQVKSGGMSSLGDSFAAISTQGKPFLDFLVAVGQSVGPVTGALGTGLGAVLSTLPPILNAVASALSWITEDSTRLNVVLAVITAGFLAYRASILLSNLAISARVPLQIAAVRSNFALAESNRMLAASSLTAGNAASAQAASTNAGLFLAARSRALILAQSAAQRVVAITSGLWAAAQWALNAAMSANPIGIVVVAVAALVAGLVLAYKNSETFRNIVNAAWSAIQTGVMAVIGWLTTAVPAAFEFVKNAFLTYTPLGLVISHWSQIWAAIQVANDTIKGIVLAAVTFVKDAFLRYTPLGFVVSNWSAIVGVIQSAVGTIRGVLNWFAGLPAMFAGWFAGSAAAVAAKLSDMLGTVRGIPGQVLSALGNLGSLLYNKGQELIQGLINGIRSMISNVGSAMTSVTDKIKGFLPGSPVKEGPLVSWNNGGAGKRLGGLLVQGLDASRVDVDAAMNRLIAPPSGGWPGSVDVGTGAGGPGSGRAINFYGPMGLSPDDVAASLRESERRADALFAVVSS